MSERTTVTLPRGLARRLAIAARSSGRSVSAIVRDALEAHLAAHEDHELPSFAGLGESGRPDTAERAEELLADRFKRKRQA